MDDNKRERIIHTAIRMFVENGFHATPTSKIAKKSKVSVGTLFNYFPTKEDLIHSIYEYIKLHSRTMFLELVKPCASIHDNLKNMWYAVIKWGLENPCEFYFLDKFNSSPYKKSFNNDLVMGTFEKFREQILQTHSSNPITDKYPEFSTLYFEDALHATTRFLLNYDVEDCDNFIESSFELLWKGFNSK